MSDEFRVPTPDNGEDTNGEGKPFDFSSLNVEETPPVGGFTAPDANASKDKRKWWQGKPREKRTKAPRTTPSVPRGGLKPALAQLYTGIGMAVMPFDPSCARVIIENADSCAAALDDLGKTNPAIRRVLISLVSTSAWGAVIMAHAPVIMAIAMHHVPALRERQEKMVGEFAEAFANMNTTQQQNGDGEK